MDVIIAVVVGLLILALVIINLLRSPGGGRVAPDSTRDETPVSAPEGFEVVASGRTAYERHAAPGDTLELEYRGETIAREKIDEHFNFNGYVVFKTGKGVFDAKRGLGGAFLERYDGKDDDK